MTVRSHAPAQRSRVAILVALCLAAFIISVDVTIVNVALPTLVRKLGASTTQLQWIVDAYSLVFAALVLAAGSLSDRLGRKGVLLIGLAVFAVGSLAGAFSGTIADLIASRAFMGLGAALMFPSTLSLLVNVFTERGERAMAIGLWGATTGIGIATGPIVGGWLLERYWWGSIFAFMAIVAAGIAVLVAVSVPGSRDPSTPPIDWRGLLLSAAGMTVLIFGVIEAPDWGWRSSAALGTHRWRRGAPHHLRPGRATYGAPHAGRGPISQSSVHGGKWLGRHLLLRSLGFHLPRCPVLPIREGIHPPGHRGPSSTRGRFCGRDVGGGHEARCSGGEQGDRRSRVVAVCDRASLGFDRIWIHDLSRHRRSDAVPRLRDGSHQRSGHRSDHGRRTSGEGGSGIRRQRCHAPLRRDARGGGHWQRGHVPVHEPTGVGVAAGNPWASRRGRKGSVGGAIIASHQLSKLGFGQAAHGLAHSATNAFLYSLAGGCRVVGAVTIVGAVVAIAFLPARPRQPEEIADQTDRLGALSSSLGAEPALGSATPAAAGSNS